MAKFDQLWIAATAIAPKLTVGKVTSAAVVTATGACGAAIVAEYFHWDLVIAACITVIPSIITLFLALIIKGGQDHIHHMVNSQQTLLTEAIVIAQARASNAEGQLKGAADARDALKNTAAPDLDTTKTKP